MNEDTIQIDTRGMDKLIRSFKEMQPVARVGILGSKSRKEGGDNATIGAKHEYGMEGMPVRSFLRIPITEHLEKKMEASGAFDEASLKLVIQAGSIVAWLHKVAIIAEGIVAEAFSTGGFGKWKPSNMKHKKIHLTLVETTQLRNSITSDVK